jgi:hypothetical protein
MKGRHDVTGRISNGQAAEVQDAAQPSHVHTIHGNGYKSRDQSEILVGQSGN